jgi:hypothetical protein
VCSKPLDFSGIEQHAAADADGTKLSGTLEPEERGLANFQNRKNLKSREEARAGWFHPEFTEQSRSSFFENPPSVGAL